MAAGVRMRARAPASTSITPSQTSRSTGNGVRVKWMSSRSKPPRWAALRIAAPVADALLSPIDSCHPSPRIVGRIAAL
ncbi:MAG: hypothetical protein AUG49_11725 [Catenulispora sp. 13_1_20CM_3_70_7]|nr:MAG: hypothetical protein AUG49_11725 [Catenulispora sp. 13_1_20CM_3_70_7]